MLTIFSEDLQRLRLEVADLLLLDQSPETLCQSLFEILRGPLKLDFYFHFLVSEDETHLELAASGGDEEIRDALGSHLEFGEAISGTVAQTGLEQCLEYMQQRDDQMTQVVREHGVCCYICEPITPKKQLIGTLSFGSRQRNFFHPQEIELLRAVAQQVTLAVDRRLQVKRMVQLERLALAGRMSAALAHEINNPLESLTNLLFLLRSEVAGEAGHALVRDAEAAVFFLAETSRRTLGLFRGKPQQTQLLNLSELVEQIVKDVSFPERVPLRTAVAPAIWVRVVPGEIRQVLLNLLINAAQFSPIGSEVLLTLSCAGELAEIVVRDEGAGISERTKARLFQPFYTTRTVGTGLGLWLSREMVERVAGTLTVKSDPSTCPGTEFIVRLPIVQDHALESDGLAFHC